MIFNALREGIIRSWQLRKIWMVFWLMNLAVTLIGIHPYLGVFHFFFRQRLVTSRLAESNLFTYYAEFFHFMRDQIMGSLSILLLIGMVYAIFTRSLLGGVLYYFRVPARISFSQFFHRSIYFLWRMLKIDILWIFTVMAVLLAGTLAVLPISALLPSHLAEDHYYYFAAGWGTVTGLLALCAGMVFDMTRLQIITSDMRMVLPAFTLCLARFAKWPLRFFTYYFAVAVLWVSVMLIYWAGQQYVPNSAVTGMVVEFLVLQLIIFIQIAVRYSRFGGLLYLIELLPVSPGLGPGKPVI